LFLLWPPRVWSQPPPSPRLRLLRLATGLFLAVSAGVGVRAIALDLKNAFQRSWKTTIPPPVAAQVAAVEKELGPEPLLVAYQDPNPWYPRMWQRVLYPRVVILLPSHQNSAGAVSRLRSRYGIRYAVSMGSPPPDPGFAEIRDLGPLLGADYRVWFGPLRP
jgi:hypothetical protein